MHCMVSTHIVFFRKFTRVQRSGNIKNCCSSCITFGSMTFIFAKKSSKLLILGAWTISMQTGWSRASATVRGLGSILQKKESQNYLANTRSSIIIWVLWHKCHNKVSKSLLFQGFKIFRFTYINPDCRTKNSGS